MKFLITIFFSINLLFASTLELSITSNPSKLNPIISSDSASSEIEQWIFNSLLKYDKDGNIIPDLAQSFKLESETLLKFKLRKDVKWQDGKNFTADDVIFTYEKIMDKNIYTNLKSYFKLVESVKKIDDYNIEVTYKKPYFKALETWLIQIIPKHILEKEKDLMTSSFNRKPIGTGPYTLKEFKNSSDIELLANESYFEGRPKIDRILYKFFPDSNTSFLMLKRKKLDMGGLTPIQIDRQIDDKFRKNYKIIERPAFSYDYLGFNLKNDKFKNIKVRQALSLGIDRQELIDILFFGHGEICTGPFRPGSYAYNDTIKTPKRDKEKAKNLLKEAGYDESNPFSFEIATSTGGDRRINAAQIIQYQLAQIGVKVKIRVMEWQAYLNTIVHPRKFEAVLLGWTQVLTPDAYPLWHSKADKLGGFNLVGYHNKKVDELIEKGASTVDRKKLSLIYQEINKIIVEDLPYLFLYIPNSITVVNKKIKNVKPSFIGIMHNQKDWIKP